MAKPLILSLAGKEIPCGMERVDRSKLYGYVELEVLDEQGRRCELATLCSDGRTVVGRGGTAFGYLSPGGLWRDKSSLTPVGLHGEPITPVASTFAGAVPLAEKATIDDYLSHNIKSVYLLRPEEAADQLVAELREGVIYKFTYSYRGGLEPDTAFLLANAEGHPFLAVGKPTTLEFLGLQQAAAPEDAEPEVEEAEEDDMDFGMM